MSSGTRLEENQLVNQLPLVVPAATAARPGPGDAAQAGGAVGLGWGVSVAGVSWCAIAPIHCW